MKTLTDPIEIHQAKSFLERFEAIPEERWCCDIFCARQSDGDFSYCALGHLGVRNNTIGSAEARQLCQLFEKLGVLVSSVNDGRAWCCSSIPMPATPKDRIVTCLKLLLGIK